MMLGEMLPCAAANSAIAPSGGEFLQDEGWPGDVLGGECVAGVKSRGALDEDAV